MLPDLPARDPEPDELRAASTALVAAAQTGRWQPTHDDVAAVRAVRDHHQRIWTVDGSGWPPGSRTEAASAGIALLEDAEQIQQETHAVYARVLACYLSPPLRRLLAAAADHEPQPFQMGGTWQDTLGAILTGDWSY